MAEDRCKDCRYGIFHGVPDLDCRRYAPRENRGENWNRRAEYPQVPWDGWCGEFYPKQKERHDD